MSISSPTVTLYDWHAKLVERAAASLAHFAASTDPSKLEWCPELPGGAKPRSIMDQLAECAIINDRFAKILSGVDPGPMPEGPHQYGGIEDAKKHLLESGANLAAVVRSLPDDAYRKTYTTARGEMIGAVLMELPVANMYYHAGAVNYIQILGGDEEFHVPEGFLEFDL